MPEQRFRPNQRDRAVPADFGVGEFERRRETRGVRVVLAGTAGGTGTTTLAALVFESVRHSLEGSPVLYDHSGGDLGARLTNGDDVAQLDDSLALHDIGPHAATGGIDALEAPHDLLIAVTAASPAGLALADELLTAVSERFGSAGLSRVVVVANGATGYSRSAARLAGALRDRFGQGCVAEFPSDTALAMDGRIPLTRLGLPARRAQAALAKRTGELLAMHRRAR
ncbi:hypothetical protein [Frondihabitans sp. VKM Ac-2883]|jgi:hypothetical protein|uniref:hypothetical protein n=1 Tax=Frondihabitans sp. VKM Ac-2883 TaxID=2783823 RepID=UPI00188B3407|nr:hypothetical protein [Frondihabitans sp. VKM Ac-2883]MBF4577751.1 hypothetical protein [Frondihabitans sp. VKM Ac-2883]